MRDNVCDEENMDPDTKFTQINGVIYWFASYVLPRGGISDSKIGIVELHKCYEINKVQHWMCDTSVLIISLYTLCDTLRIIIGIKSVNLSIKPFNTLKYTINNQILKYNFYKKEFLFW